MTRWFDGLLMRDRKISESVSEKRTASLEVRGLSVISLPCSVEHTSAEQRDRAFAKQGDGISDAGYSNRQSC